MSDQNLIPIENQVIVFQDLAKNALTTLNTYKVILAKAQAAYKKMAPVVDEESKQLAFALRDKAKRAKTDLNEARSPFTRELTKVTKEFTGTEGGFESIEKDIEAKCDSYAREELAKARAKQAEIDAKLKAEKDAIEFDGRCREVLRQNIEKLLDAVRKGTGDLVDKVTKANLATTKTRLTTEVKWKDDYTKFYRTKPDWVTDAEKFDAIAKAEFEANKTDYLTRAKTIMDDALRILDVAVNDKDEAIRMQEIAAKAQKEEAEKVASQKEKDIEAQKAIAELDMERVEAPKVKSKMKIEILDNVAWLQLMSFWYTNDPDSKTVDCSKKTFAQLKTYAENSCNKGNDILTHSSIKWTEDVKAK